MATNLALIGLGPYRFATSSLSIHKLDRKWAYRWEAQQRIGRRPAMQFLGPGEESVQLDGVIYPHYMGGFGQLMQMREAASRGDFFALASGAGNAIGVYHGRWCIRNISDAQSYFHKSGAPLKVEFQIDLVAYGGDFGS